MNITLRSVLLPLLSISVMISPGAASSGSVVSYQHPLGSYENPCLSHMSFPLGSRSTVDEINEILKKKYPKNRWSCKNTSVPVLDLRFLYMQDDGNLKPVSMFLCYCIHQGWSESYTGFKICIYNDKQGKSHGIVANDAAIKLPALRDELDSKICYEKYNGHHIMYKVSSERSEWNPIASAIPFKEGIVRIKQAELGLHCDKTGFIEGWSEKKLRKIGIKHNINLDDNWNKDLNLSDDLKDLWNLYKLHILSTKELRDDHTYVYVYLDQSEPHVCNLRRIPDTELPMYKAVCKNFLDAYTNKESNPGRTRIGAISHAIKYLFRYL